MFSKIFQKFACLDEDLPKENLPQSEEKCVRLGQARARCVR